MFNPPNPCFSLLKDQWLTTAFDTALHTLVFQSRTSFAYKSDASPIHTALKNWKRLWLALPSTRASNFGYSKSADDMWKRVGIMQHSPEFWYLAQAMLMQINASRNRLNDGHSLQTDWATHVAASVRYDETDMTQVNALIRGVQGLDLIQSQDPGTSLVELGDVVFFCERREEFGVTS